MDITLQKAKPEEWEIVENLEARVATRLFHALNGKEEYDDYISVSQVYFIVFEEKKIGTVSYENKDGYVVIDGLTLLPEYRGKKIAFIALKMIIDKIGPDKKIQLFTHPENTPAIINYLKFGFLIKEWKENYFGDGEPRILLVKE